MTAIDGAASTTCSGDSCGVQGGAVLMYQITSDVEFVGLHVGNFTIRARNESTIFGAAVLVVDSEKFLASGWNVCDIAASCTSSQCVITGAGIAFFSGQGTRLQSLNVEFEL